MNDYTKLPVELNIINTVNGRHEFQYPHKIVVGEDKDGNPEYEPIPIPDSEPTRLHRSTNPSILWGEFDKINTIRSYIESGHILVGVEHLDSTYELLAYPTK